MAVIKGIAGMATRMANLEEKPACLASWMIHAPGQSPAWSHYLLSIVHLRELDGVPAFIRLPGSSHEMMLAALDSGTSPKADDWDSLHALMPTNAEVQFFVGSDDDAVTLGEKCVQAICDGLMPAEPAFPDQGQKAWQKVVTDTAEHMRTGGRHE